MVKTLLTACIVLLSVALHAHEYYFSFAEIEIDPMTKKVELSVTVTTHDFEKALSTAGINEKLSGNESDSLVLHEAEQLILGELVITANGKSWMIELEAYEVMLNGTTIFYLSGDLVEDSFSQLTVRFDLLMDTFPEQQNKATIIYNGTKRTLEFLPNRKEIAVILQ